MLIDNKKGTVPLFALLQGLSSAQDTLGSQAYGANDRPGVLSWSVTTAVCMSVLAVPMAVVLYFGDALAIGIFQQPREVADVSLAAFIRLWWTFEIILWQSNKA